MREMECYFRPGFQQIIGSSGLQLVEGEEDERVVAMGDSLVNNRSGLTGQTN